jgi:hypothetical protein
MVTTRDTISQTPSRSYIEGLIATVRLFAFLISTIVQVVMGYDKKEVINDSLRVMH